MRPALAALMLTTAPLLAADWPGFLGPTRDAHSTETKLNWDWKATPPAVAWKVDVGEGFAGPVVADGKVILFHRVGTDDVVQAFAADTGNPVWAFKAPTKYRDQMGQNDGPRATPLVADGLVFAYGPAGELNAVDLKTGEKKWTRNLTKDYKPPEGYFGVGAGLIVARGKLLVNVGGKKAGIVALDASTGKEAWAATDDPPSYSAPAPMTLNGKPHAAFFTRTGLVVANAETGAVAATFHHRARIDASVNAATPVVRGDEVFLSASYGVGGVVLKVKGAEPEEVWANDKSLSCHFNTPVLVGELLYGVHGRQEGNSAALVCVDWKTGERKWAQEKFGCAHLIAVDGGLLALTESGELVRFDASETGYAERGRVAVLDGLTRAAPALADGRLYLRNDKQLVCVTLK